MKISTFQLTAHIGLLKGTPNAIKSVWEPKEGGRANRIKNSELKVMVYPNIPFSVFCILFSALVCGQNLIILTFFKEEYYV